MAEVSTTTAGGCMRSHGEPTFRDPSVTNGGISSSLSGSTPAPLSSRGRNKIVESWPRSRAEVHRRRKRRRRQVVGPREHLVTLPSSGAGFWCGFLVRVSGGK